MSISGVDPGRGGAPSFHPGGLSPGLSSSEEGGEVSPGAGSARHVASILFSSRLAIAGFALIVLMALFCFVGPMLYHTNQQIPNPGAVNLPPGGSHPLGTDSTGYDELGRLMAGGQSSLEVGIGVGILGTAIGVLWGAAAGFIGGAFDAVMMRLVDVFMSIPGLLLLILLADVITPSTWFVIVIFSLLGWQGLARLMRGETLSLREREFVAAARVSGAIKTRVLLRHIIPNAVGTIVVNAAFGVADAILGLAALSFLGLGLPPPAADWGGMLSTGTTYIYANYWWEIYFPGICLVLTVLAFNFIGEALRDSLEIRSVRG